MRNKGARRGMSQVVVAGCLALFGVLASAAPASAQWRVGGFLGGEHESSWDEFLVLGADARASVKQNQFEINPRFSFFVREFMTRMQFDFNVIKPLTGAGTSKIEPYVGTGIALERISFDGPFDSESALGFNYIVGATVKSSGKFQAFGQFMYSVLNDTPNNAVVSVGVHWKLSR